MKDAGTKIRGGHVFDGQAGVIEHGLVRVERNTVRALDNNGLRYSIGNAAKLVLVLQQLLFRTLTIFNVRTASIPANDFATLVANGNGANEKPPIFPVETSQARFDLDLSRLARSCDGLPLVQYLHQVFGMKCDLPSRTV